MKIAPIDVSLIDCCGSDLSVVNAARVSFNKLSEFDELGELYEKDEKLIKYLAKHKHFSPFNHAFLSFRVKAPIFVARQLVKHKFLPWNEVSRRYVTDEPEFYFPDGWRKSSSNVKQGSSDEKADIDWLVYDVKYYASEKPLSLYYELINKGVCPEQARMVLPQNTMTEWVWSGTLGAWLDMLKLRLDPHTQKETRDVAIKIHEIVAALFPVSTEARLSD
jgi:thymidylate synthase (FAD)